MKQLSARIVTQETKALPRERRQDVIRHMLQWEEISLKKNCNIFLRTLIISDRIYWPGITSFQHRNQSNSVIEPNLPNIKEEIEDSGPFRPPRHPPGPADRSQTPRPGQDHHHSLDRNADTASSTRDNRGGSKKGFTLGHRGHSSHQQGWRFCGSFKELRRGRLL